MFDEIPVLSADNIYSKINWLQLKSFPISLKFHSLLTKLFESISYAHCLIIRVFFGTMEEIQVFLSVLNMISANTTK